MLNPILRERGVRSLLGVPLMADDDVLGVLHVGTLRPHAFTVEDTQLLQLAADRLAMSLRVGMSGSERVAAAALQRSLPPGALPTVPGLELAARHVPGGGGDVGGDWYDVFALPSGGCAWSSGTSSATGSPRPWRWGRCASPWTTACGGSPRPLRRAPRTRAAHG